MRVGMTNLVRELRQLTQAGTADYTLANETYWTTEHLERILDEHRRDYFLEPLDSVASEDTGGTARYYDYYFPQGKWEEGTAQFIIQNSAGGTPLSTGYTVNYNAGHIRFTADQVGTAYYLSGRKYDIGSAAADVWEQKASYYAIAYDFTADGQSLNRSQMFDHCTKMAERFRGLGEAIVAKMRRSDCN